MRSILEKYVRVIVIFVVVVSGFSVARKLFVDVSAHTGGSNIRINAGGEQYTDSLGSIWEADNYFNTGQTYTNSDSISGTTEAALYQSERWDPTNEPELEYSVPVQNGDYEVILHFAEIYSGAQSVGSRVFDVWIEGVVVLDDYDIYLEAGANTATQKTFTTSVADGFVDILFTHEVENPKISAIEIHQLSVSETPTPTPTPDETVSPTPTSTPTPTPTPTETETQSLHLRVNSGGDAFTDTNGNLWESDNSFNTGNTYVSSNSISGTEDDYLYQSERWDPSASPELLYSFNLSDGNYDVILHFAEVYSGASSVGGRVFDVSIEGVKVLDDYDIFAEVGANTATTKAFSTDVVDGTMDILFTHETENPKISGIEIVEGIEEESNPAHAVAGEDQTVVDLDENGSEFVELDGSFSHTHAFGEEFISWVWSEDGVTIGEGEIINISFDLGTHDVTLTVEDSAGNTASDDVLISVLAPTDVQGLSGYYYNSADSTLTSIPDVSGVKPDWGVNEANLSFSPTIGLFSSTPFFDNFSAQFQGLIDIPVDGEYGFAIESDDGSKLYLDGELLIDNDGAHGMQKKSASISLTEGKHDLLIEYFEGTGDAGLKLYWNTPGGIEEIIPSSSLYQNYAEQIPVINTIDPTYGPLSGGNKVTISGYGFIFPSSQTTVNFGSTLLTGDQITILDPTTIEVIAPAGTSDVSLSVTTPNGVSNNKNYVYSDTSLPPVQFTEGTLFSGINGPTTLAFGPDGKLYVGTQFGEIWVLTIDENLNVTSSFMTDIIQTSEPTFRSILGISFNPLDDPTNPKVYVAHSHLFHGQLTDIYRGKVSVLSGTSLDVKKDLITGLPVSDHDHGINGMDFGLDGELYIQVGGNTNAGVPGALSSTGQLDEVLFSAATLVAHVERADFNGQITYDSNGNQTGGFDVEVFAAGERNPYDLVFHSNGYLYGTDNGPNLTFGNKSTGCDSEGPDPEEIDELNLLMQNGYYGHANRFRGQNDPRQCVWRSLSETSDVDYKAPLTTFPASTNGLTEYWPNNFGGQMKGHLLASRWGAELFDVVLTSDGASVIKNEILSTNGGLDVVVDWNGIIFIAQHGSDSIIYHKPDEPSQTTLFVNSVYPRKGPLTGGRDVSIYGENFDTSGASVSFGGVSCVVTSVTSSKIDCTTSQGAQVGSVDVVVDSGGVSFTLTKGYMYMGDIVSDGTWETKSALPESLGEVSAASVNGYIFVFSGHDGGGAANNDLYRYDPGSDTWLQMADQNLAPSADHAAAAVINGKIYVFGGLKNDGSESSDLVIYDPTTDSWTQGASLSKDGQSFGIGSPASGVLDGKFYIAGGINNGATISNLFVFDPSSNSWNELAPMPEGRNHVAGIGYDGKFYAFGGRCCGGNVAGSGLDSTFIYDPATNSWSQGANLPTARGGTGSAVELNGELLVIGGEGGGPSDGTFSNVEGYDPLTDSWRSLPDLPTPRHGIYPVNLNGIVYVAGGGISEGFSVSNVHEVYIPSGGGTTPSPTPTPEPSFTPTPTPTPTSSPQEPVRINTGGGQYTDSIGNLWISDNYFNTGNSYSTTNSIAGTVDDLIYQTERWDHSDFPELSYTVSVQDGDYQVILHFAEIYTGAFFNGGRVFDVFLEGDQILDNYDIYAEVGANTAVTKSFNTTVSDGSLNLLFAHFIENPKISGIEIIPL